MRASSMLISGVIDLGVNSNKGRRRRTFSNIWLDAGFQNGKEQEGEQTVGQNQKNTQEPDVNQLRKVRRDKLAELQQNGKDPFQITKFNQTHHSLEVKNLYEAHEAELLKDRKEPEVEGLDEEQKKEVLKNDYEERRNIMDANPIHVAIAGRMMFKRVMGKASFCNIQDLQGNIQVYVARDAIGTDSYADFKKSDIGDIFGLEGFAFRTRTGEISIHAEKMTLLSKSLQMLPEKFHGLQIQIHVTVRDM